MAGELDDADHAFRLGMFDVRRGVSFFVGDAVGCGMGCFALFSAVGNESCCDDQVIDDHQPHRTSYLYLPPEAAVAPSTFYMHSAMFMSGARDA